MYAFTVERPTTVDQAVELLSTNAEAKALAGGHSLIPVLKLRLANPTMLVDLSRIDGLSGIEVSSESVAIGAMTKHRDVTNCKQLQAVLPALAAAPGTIGDPHVRNFGTIGGSLANNDPNADYPAATLGLGATIITSKREILADDYFVGMFETALEPDEIIIKVSFPIASKAAYQKLKHPASGFALVGVFVSKRDTGVRVAVTGAGANGVFRVPVFEEALSERFTPEALDGRTCSVEGLNSDIHASAEFRAHLIGVMTRRAVAAANEESDVREHFEYVKR